MVELRGIIRYRDERVGADGYRYYSEYVQETLALSGLKTPIKLLEIGCGKGYSVGFYRESGIEAYGVDIDTDGVLAEDGITLFREDARSTHFPDGYFDVITETLLFDELENLVYMPENIPKILRETKRVLRRGGLLVSVPGFTLPEFSAGILGFQRIYFNDDPFDGFLQTVYSSL